MIARKDIHIRDPFVFVENGKYYLLGTTGGDCWHAGSDLTLYTSNDLENFEEVGCMVEPETLQGYCNIWAPELHFYNGRYYLIVSLFREDIGRGSMILMSDTLDGKFTPLTGEYITPKQWGCLDATLFVWQDKPYLYFSYEWTTPEGDGAIYVAELSNDLKTIVGTPKRVIDGKTSGVAIELVSGAYRGYVAEGPYAVKEDGKIALYWSAISKDGYCVARNTAEDIFLDYIFDRMVFTKDGGHCMVFTDLDNTAKITFHQPNNSPNERMRIFTLAGLETL